MPAAVNEATLLYAGLKAGADWPIRASNKPLGVWGANR